MSFVIAVANLKGGVGKSTVAVNIAAALAARNYATVLVDADRQGTATAWSAQGRLPMATVACPLEHDGVNDWVRQALGGIPRDITVIDSPPHLNTATQAIIGIADLVLVPVTPSGADLVATTEAVAMLRDARRVRGNAPKVLLVPNRVDRRTVAGRELEEALAAFDLPVGPPLSLRTAFIDAFSAGCWVGEYAPRSPASREITLVANTVEEWFHDHSHPRKAS